MINYYMQTIQYQIYNQVRQHSTFELTEQMCDHFFDQFPFLRSARVKIESVFQELYLRDAQ